MDRPFAAYKGDELYVFVCYAHVDAGSIRKLHGSMSKGSSCGDGIVSVGRNPRELCIFRGSHSLHRVSPVAGNGLRIMGVFVYEFSPGCVRDPEVNATIYGPRVSM